MSKGPLRQLIQGPLTQEANLLQIKDVVSDTGWAWNRIPFELPSDVKAMIQATPISITSRGRDRISWLGNPRGTFDLKSAYGIATNEDSEVTTSSVGWIWKLKTLPRIKTFLWMCFHGSIGVKECLVRRRVIEEDLCPICQREPESILHALRDCRRVKDIWRQLGVKETDRGLIFG